MANTPIDCRGNSIRYMNGMIESVSQSLYGGSHIGNRDIGLVIGFLTVTQILMSKNNYKPVWNDHDKQHRLFVVDRPTLTTGKYAKKHDPELVILEPCNEVCQMLLGWTKMHLNI